MGLALLSPMNDAAYGRNAFSGKRTYPCMANTGLSIYKVFKTNCFLTANEPQSSPKRGQEPALRAESNPKARIERSRRVGSCKVSCTDTRLGRHEYGSLSDDPSTVIQNGHYTRANPPPSHQKLQD